MLRYIFPRSIISKAIQEGEDLIRLPNLRVLQIGQSFDLYNQVGLPKEDIPRVVAHLPKLESLKLDVRTGIWFFFS